MDGLFAPAALPAHMPFLRAFSPFIFATAEVLAPAFHFAPVLITAAYYLPLPRGFTFPSSTRRRILQSAKRYYSKHHSVHAGHLVY